MNTLESLIVLIVPLVILFVGLKAGELPSPRAFRIARRDETPVQYYFFLIVLSLTAAAGLVSLVRSVRPMPPPHDIHSK